jgi:hypothetical protein
MIKSFDFITASSDFKNKTFDFKIRTCGYSFSFIEDYFSSYGKVLVLGRSNF